MKVHKQSKKVSIVLDPLELQQIAICLAESTVLSNRKLAYKLKLALDDLVKREANK